MYLVIGAIAAIGIVSWLSSEEKNTCANYQASSNRLFKETHLRRQQIAEKRAYYASEKEFYTHVDLHFSSMQTASAMYEQYENHKKIVAMFKNKQQSFGNCIGELKKQRDAASSTKKQAIRDQLKQIRQQFNETKEQLILLAEAKEDLLIEVRQLNLATREYKLYIKDNCGRKGRDWYERGLERARLRSA